MTSGERPARLAIYLKTLSVLVGYIFLTWFIHRAFMSKRVPDPELSLGLSFAMQQVIAIFILLGISFVMKLARHRRVQRAERFHPRIRELLTQHLTGSDHGTVLRRIRRRHALELEECLAEILGSINSEEAGRLIGVAEEFGFVRKWKRQSRSQNAKRRRKAVSRLGLLGGQTARAELLQALDDQDDLVKVEAARALMHSGERDVLAEVFYMALDQNLLVRVILTEALRPFAQDLCQSALPRALYSVYPRQVVSALEMLRAWGKSAAIPELHSLLLRPDPRVRAAALRLIPQAGITPVLEEQVWLALSDNYPEVRAAAAKVCARTKLSSAML